MRAWATGLAVLFICVAISASAQQEAGTAPIAFPESEFNFGTIYQNSTVTHQFWIKSDSRDTVRITQVWPGCGCTKVPIEDSTIAPGDSVSLGIIFSTRRFKGPVMKRPTIKTDLSNRIFPIKLYSHVIMEEEDPGPMAITPHKVDVSQFTEAPRRRAKFLIENRTDKDVSLFLIDGEGKGFDIDLPRKIKAGETGEAEIVVQDEALETSFEQSLTFEIDDLPRTRYTVPIQRKYVVKYSGATEHEK